jgi:glycerophosphoryl diester phosphodiesterase
MNFVAHRGFPALFPENTIPAFEAVMRHPECGKRIVGIENDIRLTADGEMAVFHDDAVEFRGVKTQVDRLALSELSEAVSIRSAG